MGLRIPRLSSALLLALAVWSCAPKIPTHPRAPVILISIDTLRSDRLPIYGYRKVETPAIDALRSDAILFERAYAHYPLTLPSHVSLLTGQLPPETGVRDNAGYRLAPDHPTYLPHLLKSAGYATGAAVSSYTIRASTGLAQGFELYDDAVDSPEADHVWGPERDGHRTLQAALEWLETVVEKPPFLFFHLYEPHLPYRPSAALKTRYGETYEAEIAAADAVVGELIGALKKRGLYDGALVLLFSDHGEGLGDHQEKGHGIFLYREALQVPLLVKLPGGLRAGSTVTAAAQLIDLAPTVLEAIGLEVPDGVQGTSLLRMIEGETPQRAAYAETMYPRIHYGWSALSSLIEGELHYIEAPEPELYDLVADPAERRNILQEERGAYFRMRDRLAELKRPLELPAEEDEETRSKLAALGYLSSPRPSSDTPLPDPKVALARSFDRMERAFQLFQQRDFEAAVSAFEDLLSENPQMVDAWRHLGLALLEVDRAAEALAAFEKAMALSRGSAQVAIQIGMALLALGRTGEARAHVEVAREREPILAAELGIEIEMAEGNLDRALRHAGSHKVSGAVRHRLALALDERGRHREAVVLLEQLRQETSLPSVRNALAKTLLVTGQLDKAEPLVDEVLALDPENAVALEYRGLIALERGRPGEARDALQRSIGFDDRRANAWNLLGVALYQLRDVPGALAAWEKSVEIDAEQWDSLYNLAFTAARAGKRNRALRALRVYLATAPPGRFGREIQEARRLLAQLEG